MDSLKRHAHPTTVIGWLARSRGAPVLRGMIGVEIAITHEALDQLDVGRATAYLRSWLVANGVLEPREELIARSTAGPANRWRRSAGGDWPATQASAAPRAPDRPARYHSGVTTEVTT